MTDEKTINIKVDKSLWKQVGIYASKKEYMKKTVLNLALKDFLEKNDGNEMEENK